MKKVDLNKVASLSMLKFEGEEMAKFQARLEDMVKFVSAIEKFKPKNQVQARVEEYSSFREDVITPSLSSEQIFLNTKNSRDNYFVVPIVVE